jgi:hypothetical protein
MPLNLREEEFSIGLTAKVFFDQTTQWLRWRARDGHLSDEDGEIGTRRENQKAGGGDRMYTLNDVERIARALRRDRLIDDEGMEVILQRVEACRQPVWRRKSRAKMRFDEEEEEE